LHTWHTKMQGIAHSSHHKTTTECTKVSHSN
jgi:hypothetical protein